MVLCLLIERADVSDKLGYRVKEERMKLQIKGRVEITLEKDGDVIKRIKLDNLITNAGLDTLAKAILSAGGYAGALGVPYIALGDNDGVPSVPAPSPTDTALAHELPDVDTSRRQIQAIGGLNQENNVAIFEVIFMPDEGNHAVGKQLVDTGLFWDGATALRNTGVLVSRVLIVPPLTKSPTFNTVRIKWTYEINRDE